LLVHTPATSASLARERWVQQRKKRRSEGRGNPNMKKKKKKKMIKMMMIRFWVHY
jgi:hypothetical protein